MSGVMPIVDDVDHPRPGECLGCGQVYADQWSIIMCEEQHIFELYTELGYLPSEPYRSRNPIQDRIFRFLTTEMGGSDSD